MNIGKIIYKYSTFEIVCLYCKENWLSLLLSVAFSLLFLVAIPFVIMGNIEAGRSDNMYTFVASIIVLVLTNCSYHISSKCIDTIDKTYIERMILLLVSFLSIVFFWPLIYFINISIKIDMGGYFIFAITVCIYIAGVFIFIAYINNYLQRYKHIINIRLPFFPILAFLFLVIFFEVTSIKFCHEKDIWYSNDTGRLVSKYEIDMIQFHGTGNLVKVAFAPFWKNLDQIYKVLPVIPEKTIKTKMIYKRDENILSYDGVIKVTLLPLNSKFHSVIQNFSFGPIELKSENKSELHEAIEKNILTQLDLSPQDVEIQINTHI